MTTRKDMMERMGSYAPGTKTGAAVAKVADQNNAGPIGTATVQYDAAWIPEAFDDYVKIPVSRTAAQDRMDFLKNMRVGQSFAVPSHLSKLWRDTGYDLNKRDDLDRSYAVREVNELFHRMWRTK